MCVCVHHEKWPLAGKLVESEVLEAPSWTSLSVLKLS